MVFPCGMLTSKITNTRTIKQLNVDPDTESRSPMAIKLRMERFFLMQINSRIAHRKKEEYVGDGNSPEGLICGRNVVCTFSNKLHCS
jgi:hypothetical protein